jgi:hypothetical protein
MSKQFFYTRTEKAKTPDGEDKHFTDSFDMNLVIRTYDDGDKLIVLLNDGHEEAEEVPLMEKGIPVMKGGKMVTKRERQWKQSHIFLTGNDIEAFRKAAGLWLENQQAADAGVYR